MSHDPALRTAALEALLVEKGLLSTDAINAVVDHYERDLGPQHVYTVRFDSHELWGADAEPFALTVELYESYLEAE